MVKKKEKIKIVQIKMTEKGYRRLLVIQEDIGADSLIETVSTSLRFTKWLMDEQKKGTKILLKYRNGGVDEINEIHLIFKEVK